MQITTCLVNSVGIFLPLEGLKRSMVHLVERHFGIPVEGYVQGGRCDLGLLHDYRRDLYGEFAARGFLAHHEQ